jgi:hypothetical protein
LDDLGDMTFFLSPSIIKPFREIFNAKNPQISQITQRGVMFQYFESEKLCDPQSSDQLSRAFGFICAGMKGDLN